MEYLELFSKLEQFKVRYLICGGLAVNIYGIPRMTADIDLLLDFTEKNVTDFLFKKNCFNKLNDHKLSW